MITQYTICPQVPVGSCSGYFHPSSVWDFHGWDEDAEEWVLVDRQPYVDESQSGTMTCTISGDGTEGTGECHNGNRMLDQSRCDQGGPGETNDKCPFCPELNTPTCVQFNVAQPRFYHQYKMTSYRAYQDNSQNVPAAQARASGSLPYFYLTEVDFEYGFASADWWTTHCMGDLDGDGDVDTSDLLQMLAAFGLEHAALLSDLNGDGRVDVPDLLVLLSTFGECEVPGCGATAVCADQNQNIHMATTSESRNVFDPGSDAWSNADPAFPATYTVSRNTAYFQTKPGDGDLDYCSFPPVGADAAAEVVLQDAIRDYGISSLEYDLALKSLRELRDPENVHGCKGFITYEPHFQCRCTWALSVYIRGVRDSPATLKDFEVFVADSLAGPWERLFEGTMPLTREVRLLDFSGGSGGSNGGTDEFVYRKGDFTFTSDNPVHGNNQNYHMGYLFDGSAAPDQHTHYWLGQHNRDTKFTFDFGVQTFIEQIRIAPKVRNGWHCPDFQIFAESGFRAAGPNEPSCLAVTASCNSLAFRSQEEEQFDDEITAVNAQLPSGNAARTVSAWVRPDCSGPRGAQRFNLFGYGDMTEPVDDAQNPTRFSVGFTCADLSAAMSADTYQLDVPYSGHEYSSYYDDAPIGTGYSNGRLDATVGGQDTWTAGTASGPHWMQLTMEHPRWLAGVVFKARHNGHDHFIVTTFKVMYQLTDDDDWTYIPCGNDRECIFTDPSWLERLQSQPTVAIEAPFATPVYARRVRISPQTWTGDRPSMRAGLLAADVDTKLFLVTSTGKQSTRGDLEWAVPASFDGDWAHIALTIEDSQTVTMYANGVAVDGTRTLPLELDTVAVTADNPLIIGGPMQDIDWSTIPAVPCPGAAINDWTIILKTDGDDTFQYNSNLWTDGSGVLNEDSPRVDAGNAKYPEYQSQAFTGITFCVGSLANCAEIVEFDDPIENAAALFDGPYRRGAQYIPGGQAKFDELFDPSNNKDCSMQRPGFNIQCNDNNRARWGYCNNLPNQDCQTADGNDADGVIGIGITGQDCCPIGSGHTNFFVNNDANGGQEKRVQTWVLVRNADAEPAAEADNVNGACLDPESTTLSLCEASVGIRTDWVCPMDERLTEPSSGTTVRDPAIVDFA